MKFYQKFFRSPHNREQDKFSRVQQPPGFYRRHDKNI